MQYREFGDTGIRVSEIGVGCGQLAGGAKGDMDKALLRAVDLGINLFDTADSYGRSEEILGRVLRGIPRDQVVFATKFGTVIEPDGRGSHQDHSVAHMVEALEGSLRRLRTDYIDIYQVHTPRPPCLEDEQLWATMDRLVEQGKIRCYGMSLDGTDVAMKFLNNTRGKGIQMIFNLFHQEARDRVLDEIEKRGVGLMVKVPLAGGSLSDRFGPDWPGPEDGRRKRWGEENVRRRLDLLDQARPILRANGRSTVQGALAWLLTISPNTVPIPGISSLQRLEETAAAAGMRLTAAEMKALDEIEGGAVRQADFPY